jgi:hypothetical protein
MTEGIDPFARILLPLVEGYSVIYAGEEEGVAGDGFAG